MRLAFLPTGLTEWHGLSSAFGNLFPDHSFYALPTLAEVADHGQDYPLDGFTSRRLHATNAVPGKAIDLVERAARVVMSRNAPDFVIILDDLELVNRDQPERAVSVFRAAVERHLTDPESDLVHRARARPALAQRVSFHLAVPMIEAWFFGDAMALRAAGAPAASRPSLVGASLEDFHTDDAGYLAASERDCPVWAQTRDRKKAPAWMGAERERHPKGYLQWLCHDSMSDHGTTYRETDGGRKALQGLHWPALAIHRGLNFLNALVEDVANALGESPPVFPGVAPVATSRAHRPPDHVLRNL